MTKQISMNALAEQLNAIRTAKLANDTAPTSHPSGGASDNTQPTTTGELFKEKATDIKTNLPLSVDGSPDNTAAGPTVGSLGVSATGADQKGELTPDTSTGGVSEMANMDTTHPSAKAAALLADIDASIKEASEGEADEEKLAAYCEKLASEHQEAFVAGFKFAQDHLTQLREAAMQIKQAEEAGGEEAEIAALEQALADAGVSPEELAQAIAEEESAEEESAGEEGGESDEIAALERALADAGVSPEELAQAIAEEGGAAGQAQEMSALKQAMDAAGVSPEELESAILAEQGGEAADQADPLAGLSEEEQLALLEQALAEAGVTPEQLVQGIEGGEAAIPMDEAAKTAKARKMGALKEALVSDLKTLFKK